MSWWRRTPRDPVVQSYLDRTPRTFSGKMRVADATFVALDCETTGFGVGKDRILSLAIVEMSKGRLHMARSKAWLVYQPDASLTSAVTVHGILPAETAAGLPEPAVLLELLPRIEGAVLVGHHVGFDVAMLNAALKRHHRTTLRNPMVDTAKLAMQAIDAFAKTAYPGQREPTLDEVCAQCGITPMERHTAEGDTFTTATVFLTLCARWQRLLNRQLNLADLPLVRG